MERLSRTVRVLVFWVYVLGLAMFPFAIVWGRGGALLVAPVICFLLVWARLFGCAALRRRMGAQPLSWVPDSGALAELSHRAGIKTPAVLSIDSGSLNIGSFGYASRDCTIVVTPPVWNLPRDERIVLVAREIVRIAHYQTGINTWLAQFVLVLDRLVGRANRKQMVPLAVLLRDAVVWPFTLFPQWCLRWRVDESALDRQAVKLSGVTDRVLANVFRKVQSTNARQALSLPLGVRHLFLLPPPPVEGSVARAVLFVESLRERIIALELAWKARVA